MPSVRSRLAELGQTLGRPELDQAILAEGNVSAREDEGTFWVKASGLSLRGIGEDGFVRCRLEPILSALGQESLADSEVRALLRSCRFDPQTERMPSVETFMHALLLSLPDVAFVGHAHPTPLLALLCLDSAPEIARQRLFPDEIVCCGPAAAFVPYVDPGLPLALAIRSAVQAYVGEHDAAPKTIWLQNHGLIALGATPAEVESAMLMSAKAARVWLAALQTGRPLRPLTPAQIARIHTRPDEHYRQRMLFGSKGAF